MASPYSLGANTDLSQSGMDPEMMKAWGAKLLQSGQVTPEEAAANYKALSGKSPYASQEDKNRTLASAKDFVGPPSPAASPFMGPPAPQQDPQISAQITQGDAAQAQANRQRLMAQQNPYATNPDMQRFAPMEGKSGLTESQKNEAKNTHTSTVNALQVLGDPQYDMLQERLHSSPEYQDMQAGQAKLDNLVQMQGQRPLPIDFKPLIQLGDALNGTHLADSTPNQETAAQRENKILEYMQKTQQDKRAAFDSLQSKFISANKGGAITDIQQAMQNQQNQEMAQDPYKFIRGMSPERKIQILQQNAEHQTKSLDEDRKQISYAQSLLASGSPIADIAAMDSTLKSLIGGRLTNYDLQRQKGDPAWGARWDQAISTITSGKLTPENRAQFASALQTISQMMEEERSARLSQLHDFSKAIDIPQDHENMVLQGFGRADIKPHGEAKKAINQVKNAADTVTVQDKDGNHFTMPSANLQKALSRGYTQVQ